MDPTIARLLAVGRIVYGSALLRHETRIAVEVLVRRAAHLHEQTSQ